MKIAKQRAMERACVAVARKLAVVLHRMSSDDTAFRFGRQPGTTARLAAAGGNESERNSPERADEGQGDLVESPEPPGAPETGCETD
jgi:hypothetical protein